ncbi:uncharacterized protein MEPE_06212 [Melanopsichium pennsylvanicum]|uniref:Uncharacterized protein n=2 Tax=Melanopsichium pennsylvanicum TaxID=63383 RepID=A0AAJ4XSB5_9BASI|nr:conserved hypothetical protein [Melanopsichium pennsylvanicum 4]SNX87502.1 uncharacterized protein MEPE_06212 [Melanopsichium pennsylvanicum]
MTNPNHTTSTSSTFASTALHQYQFQQQLEQHKPKLSRMSFVRDCFRLSGSVLPRILPSVLCLTLYAAIIAAADLWCGKSWTTSYSITSSLSVVVGLLLVFRNSTSYDRWYEGRKLWQDASTTTRSLAILLWINVDVHKDQDKDKKASRLARKKRALRLLSAFMVAVKHELRGQSGTHWVDLRGVLPNEWIQSDSNATAAGSAKFFAAATSAAAGGDVEAGISNSASSPSPSSRSETSPLLHKDDRITDIKDVQKGLHLSLRILAELHTYLASIRRAGLLDDLGPAGFSLLNTQLLNLSSLNSSMIRISTTPTPLIYAIHLKQSSFVYLLTLPLALVGELGWKMVPFVTVFSIMLIGLEGISSEIEDPFGEDKSDHPLDLWCSRLRWEIEMLMQNVEPGVRDE